MPLLAAVDAAFQNAQVRQIAVMLREVQSVADNEFVGNFKAAVIDFHVDFAARRLVEQRADFDAGGLLVEEIIDEVIHCRARIDDVFDEQDVAAFRVVVEVFEDVDLAGGVRIRVVA